MASLGKLPFVPDPRNSSPAFREVLGQFAEIGGLPDLPTSLSWKKSIADSAWQVYGNDQVGDCTIAAAVHMMMCWSDNTQPAPWQFDNNDVISDYNDYRTSKSGAALQNILWNWKTYGIHRRDGGNPVAVKIDDFALLDINNQAKLKLQVQRSIQLLGGCYIGIILPKFAVHYDAGAAVPQGNMPPQWDVSSAVLNQPGANSEKDPKAGHCVCAIGYNDDGLDVVTWGVCTVMSWDFFFAYMDEAWAVLCKAAWLNAAGSTPSGLTAQQLADDFNALKTAGSGADAADAAGVSAGDAANPPGPAQNAQARNAAGSGQSPSPPVGATSQTQQVAVPDVTGLTRSAAEALLKDAGLVVGAVKSQPSQTVPANGVSDTKPGAGSLVSPGTAVGLEVSAGPVSRWLQYLPTALFGLLGAVLLWVIVHISSNDGQSFLKMLANTDVARGLITFLIAIATVGIAIILAISTLVLTEGDAGDKRFDRGKQVLTVLIGVLGTIVGFYFGSQTKPSQQQETAVTSTQAPKITTKSLPDGTNGVAYDQSLEATGGTPPLKWSVTPPLPSALVLSTEGKIRGTPAAAGKAQFKFTVTDSAQSPASATAELGLDIK